MVTYSSRNFWTPFDKLEREKTQGRAGNLAKHLYLVDAMILDELGYLSFPASGGALLFYLISQFYEQIFNHHYKL